ncbi:MAG: hypothetical protein Unbinned4120contig1000_21 [Prokaryotic dsDNA virus sp.]|jgi:hypothetical protein|nr:MAG: hypothetical protein Unbinned4120contig1000_21 [Prokaryotic dsDNA virus sp.]|tara:strand:+ start:42772 stop:43488 length:717 start_codon:yes stop_codon:yes gene_type:complete
MILSDILDKLAKGELSNLSIAEGGVIKETEIVKIIGYIDESLTRLHSRFTLRQNDVLVEMHEGISTYELKAEYAMSYEGSIEVPKKYIVDIGPKKFEDDVIRITGAYDSLGNELELNNKLAPFGIFTPRAKTLQVPGPIPGQSLSVIYQAKHPKLPTSTEEDAEFLSTEIEIPETLTGALTAYVGFLTFNFLGGQDNLARSSVFMQLYDKICLEIDEKDSMGTQTADHVDKFNMRGFT